MRNHFQSVDNLQGLFVWWKFDFLADTSLTGINFLRDVNISVEVAKKSYQHYKHNHTTYWVTFFFHACLLWRWGRKGIVDIQSPWFLVVFSDAAEKWYGHIGADFQCADALWNGWTFPSQAIMMYFRPTQVICEPLHSLFNTHYCRNTSTYGWIQHWFQLPEPGAHNGLLPELSMIYWIHWWNHLSTCLFQFAPRSWSALLPLVTCLCQLCLSL